MSDFDFVIVGSGAAGAAAAWRLCQHGFKVACLERGDWMDASQYPSTRVDWEIAKKQHSNPVISERQNAFDYPVDDSKSPIAICNYNAVGGSTILYSGHFPRFQPRDFTLDSSECLAKDWPISYDDLKPYFELNEKEMAVSGLAGDPYYPDIERLLPPVSLGDIGTRLANAFNRKKWHWWPSYSAISTRDRNGQAACINLGPCNTGCPQGAKSSTDITYLPRAQKLGLTLFTNAAVSRVLTDGTKAIGVEYFDKNGAVKKLLAKSVILAASAIGTPRILLNSVSENHPNGLANTSDQVGRNLMIHPLGYVEGVFPDRLDTDAGPQGCMLYSLEHYRTKEANHRLGYMMHALRGTGPVEAALSAYTRRKLKFGADLYKGFDEFYRKQSVISLICEDLPTPNNRISLDHTCSDRFGVPGVILNYTMAENTKKMMIHGMKHAKELLIEAGAKRTYAHGPVRNAGWHTMGTACMGDDPAMSVVRPDGQCHDVSNLYVLDSSVFVTGSCVNPANTIQAIALYLSDKLTERFKHET